jgi:predicted DNA-binding transcriptional regulator YafY
MSKMKKNQRLSSLQRKQIILDRLKDDSMPPPAFRDLLAEAGGGYDDVTIRRDIKELRKCGADIQLQGQGRNTVYVLNNKNFRLPDTFSAGDLLSLTILRQAVRGYSGSYLEKQLEDIASRIGRVTIEQRDYFSADIDAAITFRPPPAHPVDPGLWETVLEATLDKSELSFMYLDRRDDQGRITVRPYHMVCSGGEWFLLAGTAKDPNLSQYSLARMSSAVKVAGKPFTLPKNFNPKAVLEQSFGGFISTGEVKMVRVRISGLMVRYVKGRIFQPKQLVEKLDDGKVIEISFPAGSGGAVPFGNVASWVLSMGPCAKVLEPPELIERVRQEARALLDQYGESREPKAARH